MLSKRKQQLTNRQKKGMIRLPGINHFQKWASSDRSAVFHVAFPTVNAGKTKSLVKRCFIALPSSLHNDFLPTNCTFVPPIDCSYLNYLTCYSPTHPTKYCIFFITSPPCLPTTLTSTKLFSEKFLLRQLNFNAGCTISWQPVQCVPGVYCPKTAGIGSIAPATLGRISGSGHGWMLQCWLIHHSTTSQ